MADEATQASQSPQIPLFGARQLARMLTVQVEELRAELVAKNAQLERFTSMGSELVAEVKELRSYKEVTRRQLEALGALSTVELEEKRVALENEIAEQAKRLEQERETTEQNVRTAMQQLEKAKAAIVATEEIALLQEVGIYRYRHPLTDAVSYEIALNKIEDQIKAMVKKDGGAVLAATNWTVNGSLTQGRAMVNEFSKLMLRAFNAEADNLTRSMKPYKLDSALNRLSKIVQTIERLGKTMNISISRPYYQLRIRELELTADFLQKQAEEKEIERAERDRLREERKTQQEIERERARLEKERQHYSNALELLLAKGDEDGATRLRAQLSDVDLAIEDVDYRAANIRAGYVYVISNFGSFGEKMVKIGMTRRLDPMDRVRELSDASVPFNFDVHALFFSKDAVGIESELHARFATARVNVVNKRREFFYASPSDVKGHLSELAGELLEYQETPEAMEYRQSVDRSREIQQSV